MGTNVVIQKIIDMNCSGVSVTFQPGFNPDVIDINCITYGADEVKKQANVKLIFSEMKQKTKEFDTVMVEVLDQILIQISK